MKLSILREAVLCLLVTGSLVLESGCSYAFVHGPPATVPMRESAPEGRQTALECTSSNAAPVIDTILAVPLIGLAVLGVVAAAESPGSCNGQGFCYFTSGEALLFAGATLAIGTLFLSSAVTGYGRTADCRRLEESLPGGPHPSARYLFDLNAIAEVRAREKAAGHFAGSGQHLSITGGVLGSASSSDCAGGSSRETGTWKEALR